MTLEPQCNELIDKMTSILAGKETRENVSAWAVSIFDNDSILIKDPIVLNYLQILGGIDLPSTDRDYLYTDEDLIAWISEIESL